MASSPPRSEFIESSTGIEIHQELMALENSFEIQRGNFRELLEKHHEFKNYSREDWIEGGSIFSLIKSEYIRPFHNYVVSIYTVIRHMQRFNNKFGTTEMRREYTNEVIERGLDEKGEFLKQLRHYFQKQQVPPITTEFTYRGDELEFDLYISK